MNRKDETGNCAICGYKKAISNRAFRGPKIPDGPGKCCRGQGLCEAKTKAVEIRSRVGRAMDMGHE